MVTSTANPPQIAQLTQLSRPGLLTTLRRQPLAAIGFALLALGLDLQYGYTGLINFGVVAFFAVGAYSSALLALHVPWNPKEVLPPGATPPL